MCDGEWTRKGPCSGGEDSGAFVVIARELHFGRAAASLHLGASAVSRQIAALERDTGLRLLSRSTRFVRLTREGELFLPVARQVLDVIDRARKATAALRSRQRAGAPAPATEFRTF